MTKTKRRERVRIEDPETPEPNYGARPSQAKVCATCGHPYIKPCTTPKQLETCPNALFLASKPKGKKK